MTEVVVTDVHKTLGSVRILQGASFRGEPGRIVALLGASGSGKTTLLRCVAGLETPEQGRITIGGAPVFDATAGLALPPERRNIGLVFQSYALWPHRTVAENVAFGLKLRRVSKADVERRVHEILAKLGLEALAARFPHQLSGGQQQRVAICRALVYEPQVILLDEPLSNLDAKLREEARFWIRKLILDLGLSAVVVTHDQSEALAMSDHILLLKDGTIVQEGTPLQIYSQPTNRYAAEFLGANNVIAGRITLGADGGCAIAGEGWSLSGTPVGTGALAGGQSAIAVIRLEHLQITDAPGPDRIPMRVEASIYLGDRWEHRLRKGDLALKAHGPRPIATGEVWCAVPQEHVWLFADMPN